VYEARRNAGRVERDAAADATAAITSPSSRPHSRGMQDPVASAQARIRLYLASAPPLSPAASPSPSRSPALVRAPSFSPVLNPQSVRMVQLRAQHDLATMLASGPERTVSPLSPLGGSGPQQQQLGRRSSGSIRVSLETGSPVWSPSAASGVGEREIYESVASAERRRAQHRHMFEASSRRLGTNELLEPPH
jgi:hypothetical protein